MVAMTQGICSSLRDKGKIEELVDALQDSRLVSTFELLNTDALARLKGFLKGAHPP
jgi:hypothetical protein